MRCVLALITYVDVQCTYMYIVILFISNVFKKKGSQKLLDLKGIKIHVIHLVDNILHWKLNLGVISVHACMRVCL